MAPRSAAGRLLLFCGAVALGFAEEPKLHNGTSGTHSSSAVNAFAASSVRSTYKDQALQKNSSAPLHTFYVYRAMSGEAYAPVNVNAANLAGVLWYLHHEVVIQYPRKFGITKIVRFKVQTRAPEPLHKLGMNFGPRGAFDKGQMTGPYVCGRNTTGATPEPKFCNGTFATEQELASFAGEVYRGPYEWAKFGYFVGCNKLGDWPYPEFEVAYPGAIWYSFPGPCLSATYDSHTEGCGAYEPGGYCNSTPTGAANCTWTYQYMGEVSVDELVGKSSDQLNNEGGREYDPLTDKGIRFSWWDGLNNATANSARMRALSALFAARHPNQTKDGDLPSPTCDFKKEDFYKEFFWRDPRSGSCRDAKLGDECYRRIMWGMRDGINGHPDWYPTLTPASPFKDFQRLLFAQGQCPYRPCDEGEEEAATEVADGNATGNATGGAAARNQTSTGSQEAGQRSVCIGAKPGDPCYEVITFAMREGIYAHPEWYPGLTSASGFRDFQRVMYYNALPECPYRPCEDGETERQVEEAAPVAAPDNATAGSNASAGGNASAADSEAEVPAPDIDNVTTATGVPTQANSTATAGGACATAKPGDACYEAVSFAMKSGIYAHPEWYPALTPASSFEDFQQALFLRGLPQCATAPCADTEERSHPTAEAAAIAGGAYDTREVWP